MSYFNLHYYLWITECVDSLTLCLITLEAQQRRPDSDALCFGEPRTSGEYTLIDFIRSM